MTFRQEDCYTNDSFISKYKDWNPTRFIIPVNVCEHLLEHFSVGIIIPRKEKELLKTW